MHPAGSDEQQEVLRLVVDALERLEVRYCIGGSVASNDFGFFRATQDADIVAALWPKHVTPLVGELAPVFYIDAPAVQSAVTERRSFNVIHLETLLKVDVFVAKRDDFHTAQLRRRVRRSLDAEGAGVERQRIDVRGCLFSHCQPLRRHRLAAHLPRV